jgi:hypothetical protein
MGKHVPHVRGHKLLVSEERQVLRFPREATKSLVRNAGKCECGETSPKGLTDYNVRSWHREHRLKILAEKEQEKQL